MKFIICFFSISFFFISCKKDAILDSQSNMDNPIISNLQASEIHLSSAKLNASILSEGSTPTQTRGFYYSSEKEIAAKPINMSGISQVAEQSKGKGDYSLTIQNLKPNTSYYFNCFTFNSASSEVFGKQLTFKTNSLLTKTTLNKVYGGLGYDGFYKLIKTKDGNLLAIGESNSSKSGNKITGDNGKGDGWVSKLDLNGNIIWEKNFGGNNRDYFIDGCNSIDGGFLLAGGSASTTGIDITGYGQIYLVKIDNNGNKIWAKNLNIGTYNYFESIFPVLGGGYLLTSTAGQSCSFTKIEENGNVSWTKKLNFDFYSGLASFEISTTKSNDGNLLILGYNGNNNALVIFKINNNGEIIKQLEIPHTSLNNIEYLSSSKIIENTNGDLILAITNGGSAPNQTIYSINPSGKIVWNLRIGDSIFLEIYDLVQSITNNQYYIVGTSNQNIIKYKTEISRGNNDGFLMAIDENGNYLFDKTFGGNDQDEFRSAIFINNDIFILGNSNSNAGIEKNTTSFGLNDGWLIKTSFSEESK
jgi:hypothetical protein